MHLFIIVSEFLKTLKWQTSNRLLNTRLKLLQPQSCASRLKQQLFSFHPGFTHYSQFPRFRVYSTQFQRCFCNRSENSELKEKPSADLNTETQSQFKQIVSKLSHIDDKGHAKMVDVSAKEDTSRVAVATATVYLGAEAFRLVKENKIHKGDVLTVAQLAGIMASKVTPSLIPLCHSIHITHAEVNLELHEDNFAVCITGMVNSVGKTGVEMESLTAVTVAALTVYDMCKAVSCDIVISDVKLVSKSGGKSGEYGGC